MTRGPSFSSEEKVICAEFSGPETREGAFTTIKDARRTKVPVANIQNDFLCSQL